MRILLVEDDKDLARRLALLLEESGLACDVAEDGEVGLHLAQMGSYDAIVLDLGLPVFSGMEVLRRLRGGGSRIPVLVLSARTGWVERVEGLNAGADDYLEKPFQSQEVVARLRSLLRRSADQPTPLLRHGEIALDATSGSVTVSGQPVQLTAREFRILNYLLLRPGRNVTQDELIDGIYNQNEPRNPNTVEVYIGRLRKKLGRTFIKTVRGFGYRIG